MPALRQISDLHLEGYAGSTNTWFPGMPERLVPSTPQDKDTILVLAGDITTVASLELPEGPYPTAMFFTEMCKRFLAVIYIPGNHEYYRGLFPDSFNEIVSILETDYECGDNFHPLTSDSMQVIVNGVTIIGTTLWTDNNQQNPLSRLLARQSLNDYRMIYKPDGGCLTPEDTDTQHYVDRAKLFDLVKAAKQRGEKVVVVSHHAPSAKSTHPRFRGDHLNHCYHSRLDEFILDAQPDVWMHGHMHDSSDYRIGKTRVVANPYGYIFESRTHIPVFVVHV